MKKSLILLLILFSLLFSKINAQVVLHANESDKFNLEQKIENNFLVLNAEKKITKVVLFNRKSEETITHTNNKKNISIDLNNYGVSPYTVMVHTSGGDIVLLGINIIKMKYVERPSIAPIIKEEEISKPKVIAHWVIKETSKNLGSSFSARYVHKKSKLDIIIEKNKFDNKTIQGKSNGLTVYEVYDLSTFSYSLRKELLKNKPNEILNINDSELKAFNSQPIYNSRF